MKPERRHVSVNTYYFYDFPSVVEERMQLALIFLRKDNRNPSHATQAALNDIIAGIIIKTHPRGNANPPFMKPE